MDTQSFEEKLKDAISSGVKASKEALSKAGSAVQKFSDKSVIKIERSQLVNKQKDKYTEMGKALSKLLKIKGSDFGNLCSIIENSEDAANLKDFILSCQTEIKRLDKEIIEHDKQLEEVKNQ